MIHWLKQLEMEMDIEILFACRAGSRAWGMESLSSDYDIRFIYKHNDFRRYLSLNQPREVIEKKEPFDAVGWDLMKTLKLFRKSNPSLFEWIQSPIYYVNNYSFAEELKGLIIENYSLYSLFMHYHTICTRNLREIKSKSLNDRRQKQLIYALRSFLIAREIVHYQDLSFVHIKNPINTDVEGLNKYYNELVDAKRNQLLISVQRADELQYLLENEQILLLEKAETLPKGQDITLQLNTWMWKLLGV